MTPAAHTPGKRGEQLKKVIHMSGETPSAADQKTGVMGVAFIVLVFGRDELCHAPPEIHLKMSKNEVKNII